MATDLHSALDQVKGNHRRVRGAATQNPTESTQDQILPGAELTTVAL